MNENSVKWDYLTPLKFCEMTPLLRKFKEESRFSRHDNPLQVAVGLNDVVYQSFDARHLSFDARHLSRQDQSRITSRGSGDSSRCAQTRSGQANWRVGVAVHDSAFNFADDMEEMFQQQQQ